MASSLLPSLSLSLWIWVEIISYSTELRYPLSLYFWDDRHQFVVDLGLWCPMGYCMRRWWSSSRSGLAVEVLAATGDGVALSHEAYIFPEPGLEWTCRFSITATVFWYFFVVLLFFLLVVSFVLV